MELFFVGQELHDVTDIGFHNAAYLTKDETAVFEYVVDFYSVGVDIMVNNIPNQVCHVWFSSEIGRASCRERVFLDV